MLDDMDWRTSAHAWFNTLPQARHAYALIDVASVHQAKRAVFGHLKARQSINILQAWVRVMIKLYRMALRTGLCLACATLSACASQAASKSSSQASTSLFIQGYNYTDLFIDSFTVNGQGGGNVFVSSPTTGGGGSVCCFSFDPNASRPIQLKVRWAAAYCLERKANPLAFGPRFVNERQTLWKEANVALHEVAPNPQALEVHFFPDGHVEAAITKGYSPPRLKLPITEDEQRPGVPLTFPACRP